MRPNSTIFGLLILGAVTVNAQQQPTIDGKWTGTVPNLQGNPLNIEVVLQGQSGSWRMTPQSGPGRNNPCFGRELPITVTQSESQVTIEILGDKVIQGCMNQTASMKLLDPKTLEGALKDGRPIKLSR